MDKVLSIMDQIAQFLAANGGSIGSVLGIVLFVIAKMKSTEQAVGIVKMIQGAFDMLAKVLKKLGEIMEAVAGLLAALVASDGIGGKK